MKITNSLMKLCLVVVGVFAAGLAFSSCGKGGGGFPTIESGECTGGGWCGEQAIDTKANIAGAEALFIQSSSGSVLSSISPGKAVTTVSSASPLFSVTTSGVVGVLAASYPDGSSALSGLPRLSFVAVSPIYHIILVFEHPFTFTSVAEDGTRIENYSDPWAPSSPFTCQIYVVNRKINDSALDPSNPPGLTCLTTELELNTWDFRSAMVQFDGNGGVYFTAHVPQNWKNVLLKWTPGTDDPATSAVDESVNGTLSEVINANICFREFTVTNEGGVLYTGITSTSGDCSGTSFLRFENPSGELDEITSGWWDYVFQPIESTLFANANISADINTANIGQILFYGPNPDIATTPEWNDACLFRFNPNATSDEGRNVQIADCSIDMWEYIDISASNTATKRTRCTEIKSMMGGENRPEKILLGDFNGDGNDYEIYVVGRVSEKKAGQWRYDMCVDEAHCVDANSVPDYTYNGNQGGCEGAAGHAWKTYNDCYNQMTDATFYTTLSTGAAANDSQWRLNGEWCQQPASNWLDIYNAFALVIHNDNGTTDDEDDDTRQIVRFSDNNEIVKNGWIVNNRLVYSAFNTDSGSYKLREIRWTDSNSNGSVDTTDGADDDTVPDEVTKTDLLSGIEVYELFADPRSNYAGKWFFNGLRFSDNQYITGTFNPDAADPNATLVAEEDITGQIETLVIVPEF